MKTVRRFGFSPGTLDRALHDLATGKTLDQYNLPSQVRESIANTHYTERDIRAAFAEVDMPERVLAF